MGSEMKNYAYDGPVSFRGSSTHFKTGTSAVSMKDARVNIKYQFYKMLNIDKDFKFISNEIILDDKKLVEDKSINVGATQTRTIPNKKLDIRSPEVNYKPTKKEIFSRKIRDLEEDIRLDERRVGSLKSKMDYAPEEEMNKFNIDIEATEERIKEGKEKLAELKKEAKRYGYK